MTRPTAVVHLGSIQTENTRYTLTIQRDGHAVLSIVRGRSRVTITVTPESEPFDVSTEWDIHLKA
jgi:hypothetical protein